MLRGIKQSNMNDCPFCSSEPRDDYERGVKDIIFEISAYINIDSPFNDTLKLAMNTALNKHRGIL